jgi:hypothetical protein
VCCHVADDELCIERCCFIPQLSTLSSPSLLLHFSGRVSGMAAAGASGGESASLADVPEVVARAKGKAKGRPKVVSRPRLDLDEEIDQANKLAEASRKMMNAAKTLQKNNRRCKQWLLRKAGKLSPEDLERIAVLKRCGLYAEKVHDDDAGEQHDDAAASGDEPAAAPSAKKSKLVTAVQKIAGAEKIFMDFRDAMEMDQRGSSSSSAQASASNASSGSGSRPIHPRGRRLGPQVSSSCQQ